MTCTFRAPPPLITVIIALIMVKSWCIRRIVVVRKARKLLLWPCQMHAAFDGTRSPVDGCVAYTILTSCEIDSVDLPTRGTRLDMVVRPEKDRLRCVIVWYPRSVHAMCRSQKGKTCFGIEADTRGGLKHRRPRAGRHFLFC